MAVLELLGQINTLVKKSLQTWSYVGNQHITNRLVDGVV